MSAACFLLLTSCSVWAAQSSRWTQTRWAEANSGSPWEIGVAFTRDGLAGLSYCDNESSLGGLRVMHHFQERQPDGTTLWRMEEAFASAFTFFPMGTSLDYDSTGGAGIILAVKGLLLEDEQVAEMAIVFMYKPRGGSFGPLELVYSYNPGGLGVTALSAITARLRFDTLNRPVVAFINKRQDIEDTGDEWQHATAHIAVRTTSWSVFDLENPLNSPFGFPVECGGLTDIDLDIDASNPSQPYLVYYVAGQWKATSWHDPCVGENVVVEARANDGGVVSQAEIPQTITPAKLYRVSGRVSSGTRHVALQTSQGTIYYLKSNSSGWSSLFDIAQGQGTVNTRLGSLIVKSGAPHVSLFRSGRVYVVNGPGWPASPSNWVLASKGGTSPDVVLDDFGGFGWRCRMAASPNSSSIAVGYRTESDVVVATGCAGDAATAKAASAAGDVLMYGLLTAALLGARRLSNRKRDA